jgi:hypothetical protein
MAERVNLPVKVAGAPSRTGVMVVHLEVLMGASLGDRPDPDEQPVPTGLGLMCSRAGIIGHHWVESDEGSSTAS